MTLETLTKQKSIGREFGCSDRRLYQVTTAQYAPLQLLGSSRAQQQKQQRARCTVRPLAHVHGEAHHAHAFRSRRYWENLLSYHSRCSLLKLPKQHLQLLETEQTNELNIARVPTDCCSNPGTLAYSQYCENMAMTSPRARGLVGRTGSPSAPRMLLLLLLDSGASLYFIKPRLLIMRGVWPGEEASTNLAYVNKQCSTRTRGTNLHLLQLAVRRNVLSQ